MDIPKISAEQQKSCWITYTNQAVHDILKTGFEKSPMFQGRIKGTGPRYCPSIEDKINRFAFFIAYVQQYGITQQSQRAATFDPKCGVQHFNRCVVATGFKRPYQTKHVLIGKQFGYTAFLFPGQWPEILTQRDSWPRIDNMFFRQLLP